jgi:hypothetical protein
VFTDHLYDLRLSGCLDRFSGDADLMDLQYVLLPEI